MLSSRFALIALICGIFSSIWDSSDGFRCNGSYGHMVNARDV